MLKIHKLIWDDWNIQHISRHKVTPDEVSRACQNDPIFIRGNKRSRVLALGYRSKGRLIAVVLDPTHEKGVFYPVTARPASRKERQYYTTKKGGENATA